MSNKGRYRTQTPDLLDEIKDLKERLSRLERSPQLPNSAIDGQQVFVKNSSVSAGVSDDLFGIHGRVNLFADDSTGGQFNVARSNSVPTLIPEFPGAFSMLLNTSEGNDPDIKFPTFNFYDKNGDVLISDSFNARQGFDHPRLQVPWYDPNLLASSVSGTFSTFARAVWYTYHAHLRVSVVTTNPATTTSQVTVVDTTGPTTLGTITGPANSTTFTDIVCMRRSLTNYPTANGNNSIIDIQLRRASGAGTCQAGVTDIVGIDLSTFNPY